MDFEEQILLKAKDIQYRNEVLGLYDKIKVLVEESSESSQALKSRIEHLERLLRDTEINLANQIVMLESLGYPNQYKPQLWYAEEYIMKLNNTHERINVYDWVKNRLEKTTSWFKDLEKGPKE